MEIGELNKSWICVWAFEQIKDVLHMCDHLKDVETCWMFEYNPNIFECHHVWTYSKCVFLWGVEYYLNMFEYMCLRKVFKCVGALCQTKSYISKWNADHCSNKFEHSKTSWIFKSAYYLNMLKFDALPQHSRPIHRLLMFMHIFKNGWIYSMLNHIKTSSNIAESMFKQFNTFGISAPTFENVWRCFQASNMLNKCWTWWSTRTINMSTFFEYTIDPHKPCSKYLGWTT